MFNKSSPSKEYEGLIKVEFNDGKINHQFDLTEQERVEFNGIREYMGPERWKALKRAKLLTVWARHAPTISARVRRLHAAAALGHARESLGFNDSYFEIAVKQ